MNNVETELSAQVRRWTIKTNYVVTVLKSGERGLWNLHNSDVIMDAMASQIASLTNAYLTIYTGADQRKHQSSAGLCARNSTVTAVNFPHKWPVTWKMNVWLTHSRTICTRVNINRQCYQSNIVQRLVNRFNYPLYHISYSYAFYRIINQQIWYMNLFP